MRPNGPDESKPKSIDWNYVWEVAKDEVGFILRVAGVVALGLLIKRAIHYLGNGGLKSIFNNGGLEEKLEGMLKDKSPNKQFKRKDDDEED